jgi:tyrosyl-DNA phosphodiesterase-1
MHDLPWLRQHLTSAHETRIQIRIVHGYWRHEDERRKVLEQGIWGPNVRLIGAFLPDIYGTHHCKILVLFRDDDTAQVVVQTGMILSPNPSLPNPCP